MAVNLSPYGGVGAQFLDNSGNVLTGGKIYTYAAGTTTNQAVYTSAAGNIFHPNPIILDASGRVPSGGEMWLTDGLLYKFVLETSTNVLIATYDNIAGINSNFVNFVNEQEIQTATAGQTVFNLATTNYSPGTNSLSVFVDGVNQYGPGAQYAYLETDSDTVTFINGLHLGALVKFTTSQLSSSAGAAAAQVSFIGFKGQVGTVQNLAGNDGSDWVGFVQSGAGVVARSVQDKLRDFWDVEDFAGATDQIKVQAAFDSGEPIKFSRNYSVDSVTIRGVSQTIDFNGYYLIGTRSFLSIAAGYVLGIAGRQLILYNVAVNADFKNYVTAIRWFSETAGTPAQFNNVYGMAVAYALTGLIFGAEIGSPSQNAPQSENTVYGFKCRGVRTCFTGNQTNGFITLVGPQLDCSPYEWLTQPGFNLTAYQTAARSIINIVGVVVILGGEVLKTSTQLGFGVEGKNITMIGTVIEIACANFFVQGGIALKDISNFFMASDSTNLFTIDIGTVFDADTMVTLDNCTPQRANDVWTYSGVTMIQGTSTVPVTFNFVNCRVLNWSPTLIASSNASIVGAGQVSNAIIRTVNTQLLLKNATNAVVKNITLQNTSSATPTASAIVSATTIQIEEAGQIFHVSGTAAIQTIFLATTSFRGSVTIIPDNVFTLVTGGNIAKASTAIVNQAMTLHYDGALWHSSY